ncbi:MAG TPA: DNA ligase D [Terriglobia bacterium]|nr:DNA ligase D [Terriglobia bacterium]
MGLEEYKRKRKFDETPEPAGNLKKAPGNSFVIQKHRATRLHYDFRLEMDGVLRSWAIPKGPSFNPSDKRLAVETEDHPMDYGSFEGTIPKGNYGAGKVIIWDNGTYEMVDPETPEKGWKKGKLHFVLKGKKLKGEWILVRGSREPKQWIFFKKRDEHSSTDIDVTESRPESVVSGKLVDEMGEQSRSKQWVTPIERELEQYGMKEPGRVPLPKDIQPMLATLVEKPFTREDWLFELKLDGIRALVVKNGAKLDMWTRNAKGLTNRFPTLAAAFSQLPVDTAVIDGEIVALDEKGHSHFNLIQPRIHLSGARNIAMADEQIPVYFYAFDLLYLNGYNLMKFPLIERKAVLRKLIPNNDEWIRFADHVEGNGVEFFKAVEKHGLEGIVAKLKKSEYQQARSKYWLKIKTQQTDHFVVGGFTPPEGSRKHFGALLLGLYRNGDLIHVGRTGSGFDDRTLAEAYKALTPLVTKKNPFKEVPAELKKSTWVRPELVCEVKFTEWTPDKKLRAPIFQGFRDDIDPEQCTLEESIPERGLESATKAAKGSNSSAPSVPSVPSVPFVADSPGPRSSKIEFTNLDKVFWPDDGYTKGDLIDYYDKVSPYLIPHLLDRPLVFERFPDGIYGPSFYQKDAPDYTPGWIRTEKIWSADVERHIRYFIGADRDQLLYIANSGNIQQNPWMSRIQHMDFPDYLVFDLDPVEAPFSSVQEVAVVLKAVLDELGLRSYPKTSGASGIHVFLPVLENTFTYEDVRVFAEAVASIVVKRLPAIATIQRVVKRRKPHEVYVDFLQNIRGKTVASVYSPRPRAGAPVSTPLKWEEFKKPIDPNAFTIKTIFKRLDKFGDLFEKALTDRQDIAGFLETLRSRQSRVSK